jgi:putative hydrolase of HD superfamily
MSAVLCLTDDDVLEIVRQLCLAYRLKHTLRYNTERDQSAHSESVAEHVFALHFLARYFVRIEILPRPLDMEKVGDLITFHDFGEIPGGDKPYIFKTGEDEERERRDAVDTFLLLPTEMRRLALHSWEEYEEKKSLEARFVNALDKVEPCFELYDPVSEHTLKRLGYTYEAHVGRKLEATKEFPVMRKFVEVTARDLASRGAFSLSPAAAE